jgi:hypothetical protein
MLELLSLGGNIYWTNHSRAKLRQYRLSESRIKRVLRHPQRLEVGVAPNTVAGMQPAGSKKHPYEIWVMWTNIKSPASPKLQLASTSQRRGERGEQIVNIKSKFNLGQKIKIISVWKYPGASPVHEPPPIPEDVWEIVRQEIRKK